MAKKLYVGNLPFDSTEEDVRDLFEQVGPVKQVNLVADRDTGRPRGFGFVEMVSDGDADSAIEALNGEKLSGRKIAVKLGGTHGSGGGVFD